MSPGFGGVGKAADAGHALVLAAEREEHVVAVHLDDLRPVPRFVLQSLGVVFRSFGDDLIERHAAERRRDFGLQLVRFLAPVGHRDGIFQTLFARAPLRRQLALELLVFVALLLSPRLGPIAARRAAATEHHLRSIRPDGPVLRRTRALPVGEAGLFATAVAFSAGVLGCSPSAGLRLKRAKGPSPTGGTGAPDEADGSDGTGLESETEEGSEVIFVAQHGLPPCAAAINNKNHDLTGSPGTGPNSRPIQTI